MKLFATTVFILLLVPVRPVLSQVVSSGGVQQDTLTLASCYAAAEANHPLQPNLRLHDRIAALRLRDLDAALLPKMTVGGQAMYLSDVPSFPAGGASAPSVSNDQYKVSLEVEQVIYAGGLTGAQREVGKLRSQLDKANTATDVYSVRERVDAAFFAVLLQNAVLATLHNARSTLEAELGQMEARIREGVVPAGASDVLTVEIIRLEQQISEASSHRDAAASVLSTLTGQTLAPDVVLVPPNGVTGPTTDPRQRPEYLVLDRGRSLLEVQQSIARRKRRPQLGSRLELAYGRPPGQDFFEDSFAPFFTVGLLMRWSPWDWGRASREVGALEAERQILDSREAAFARKVEVEADGHRRDIQRYEELLAQDDRIIELRQRITSRASSQLANGVITATEFVLEENAERQARLTRDLHATQMGQARARLSTTLAL